MTVELRILAPDDAPAHLAGEDESTVRWLSGGVSTLESTRRYLLALADNHARGEGKRGFGVWWNGRLAGYVDATAELLDGMEPGDVNITYAVHPWARGNGVAASAVDSMCQFIVQHQLGSRAVIRVARDNHASRAVPAKCGFTDCGEYLSHDGEQLCLFRRDLFPG